MRSVECGVRPGSNPARLYGYRHCHSAGFHRIRIIGSRILACRHNVIQLGPSRDPDRRRRCHRGALPGARGPDREGYAEELPQVRGQDPVVRWVPVHQKTRHASARIHKRPDHCHRRQGSVVLFSEERPGDPPHLQGLRAGQHSCRIPARRRCHPGGLRCVPARGGPSPTCWTWSRSGKGRQ